ncbi:MAG TPA: transglycosylase SLT domain-containing protein [Gammaproteobacteria bacterium]|nr:transglycosylase SLT domain-containing protein [Gammaproteobacteria bacterium]HET7588551.1 transglycosylase SLT domain-containing protein [Gammaproteobacteria bacterium]
MLLLAFVVASPAFAANPAPTAELIALVKKAVSESTSFKDRFAAQVWLMDMSARLAPRMPDAAKRLKFLRLLHAEATHADVPPELVLAVIEVESDFRRFAISRVGARGFMQVMPFWLKEIGKPDANLFEAETNLRIGCTILHYYLDRADGDLREALAHYNGSVNSFVYSDKVLWALAHQWYRE